jgi:hypothetical protein
MYRAEKRERHRFPIALPIEYCRIDSDSRSNFHLGYTVNASEEGLMVVSRDEIPAESDVGIKVFFCSPDLRWVEAQSYVVWKVKNEETSNYLSGIKIMRAGQEDLREWEQFLDNLSSLRPF